MADEGFDRRTFIKAAVGAGVGASALGVAGASTFGMLRPISDVNVDVVPITYPAIQVLPGSPAPYGLPLIPLTISGSNDLVGRPDAMEGQLNWYRYCSHERAPGTTREFDTSNDLLYFVTEEKIAKGFNAWYKDYVGRRVNVEDFPAQEPFADFRQYPGVGAAIRWRSDDVAPEDTITGIVIRAPEERIQFSSRVPEPLSEQILNEWFPEDPNNPGERFVCFCSFCTHFCCVPGFHEAGTAISSGFGDMVFCTCHLSRYDPFTITMYDRTIFVFPEAGQEAAAGGEHA